MKYLIFGLIISFGVATTYFNGSTELKVEAYNVDLTEVYTLEDSLYNFDKIVEQKDILMTFWTTSCPPCVAELPLLNEIAKNNKDLKVINISHEPTAKILNYLGYYDYNNIEFLRINKKFNEFGVRGTPWSILIKDGKAKVVNVDDL